jgi:very-short-patch-repair endonuclease
MSYDKTKIKNQEQCNCENCVSKNVKSENQTVEYPKLSEEEIEQIISERYSDKDEKTKTFIRKALKIHGDRYDYSNVIYIKAISDVEIICRVESHKPFLQPPHTHLQGHGCRECAFEKLSKLYKMTKEEFIKESNEKHGVGTYDYSKVVYVYNHTKVIIICPKHGEFPQTPNSHTQNHGCPKCNNYKGEIIVRKFLIENKIKFEEQKRFNDCRNIKPLPFDFYIPQYNLCIEFDGEQHFIPHAFNSRKETEERKLENLKIVQFRDQIKNDYCKNNGINLLRIRYDENVEEKLTEYFQNHESIKD